MKSDKITDEELVKKSLEDLNYFAHLYDRYEKKLMSYIFRISNFSISESEDILQESFIKAWKNLNDFDGKLKFSSWIYRIVHNTTISMWNKSQSKGKNKEKKIDTEIFENLASKINIEEELDLKINSKIINKILSSMDEKYSIVLILKYLEGKDYKEISDILQKPSGTIATLINRAKKDFIQKYNDSKIILKK